MSLMGLRIEVPAGLVPSEGSQGEAIAFLFQFLEAAYIPWHMVPSLHFQSQRQSIFSLL